MKINIFYILFLALGLSVSSCNLLDVESPNDIDADNAIQTAANAENALLGLYTSLQNKNYYGGMFPLVADAMGDNCSTGGFDNPVLDEIGAKSVTPTNGIVEDLWLSLYFTIANCNRLIEALPNVKDLDADRRKEIEGQARTIRAMTHFDLLRSFGYHWDKSSKYGIPLVKTVQGVGDIVPRATVAESFTFIINELEASANLVTGDDRSVQFINPTTIKALLARVYLYEKNMTKARDNAAAVINDGSYALLDAANFPAIYSDRRTSESVFELAFDNQNRSNYNALTYSRPDALRTELFFLANASLATFFDTRPGDARATLLNYSTDDNDGSITSDGSGRTQKYRGEDAKDNPAYIIRLAEMYLIRAEARGLAGGVEDINLLRANRGLGEAAPANAAELEQLIWDERRAELNFEGHAFFDVARTGRAASILGDDFRAALPIPLREINATNGAIEQNPQY